MLPYANRSGSSGVVGYQLENDAIQVEFRDGTVNLYNRSRTRPDHVDYMKQLAAFGHGLNRYINRSVNENGGAHP
ncbi:MAG: hypothetical protein K0U98_25120 [Deltaproteobacteria bacterium]|nr:hypothetical protein [Deltaproteobacteria bacterium]